MDFPPGIVYIVKDLLPGILAPPLASWGIRWLVHRYTALDIQGPLFAVLCVFSFPLVFTVKVQLKQYTDSYAARARGAILPPQRPSSIGGIQLILDGLKNAAKAYPGEPLAVLAKTLGHTFCMRILFENRFFTTEPEHLKIILATQFANFEKGKDVQEIFGSLLGLGVFGADGDLWKFHRAMTRPFFKRDRVSDFEIFDRHALVAIAQLKKRLAEGHPVDFQDLVSRFTMDSSGEFLFGHNPDTLQASLPYPSALFPSDSDSASAATPSSHFATALSTAENIVFERGSLGGAWPLHPRDFWVDRMEKPMGVIRAFLDPILDGTVQRKGGAGSGTVNKEKLDVHGAVDREVQEGETLVEHLLNYTDDQTILRDEILNISVAARDTTSCLLTFTLYMLTQHPDAMARLRAEVLDVVGPARAPTPEDFREMKYLRAVLNETLRFYPPVPFNMRSTLTPVTLPAPAGSAKPDFYIPAHSKVIYSVMVMHRRTDLWGPDATEWDPDRFIDARLHKYLTPNPFIFLPFNAGPRICLGQQFAYHEASVFLVRLLQALPLTGAGEICLADEVMKPVPSAWKLGEDEMGWKSQERVALRNHVTLYVEDGLWIKTGREKDVKA